MRKLLVLALCLLAFSAQAQQPAFRTVQSSQDPTGPLGLLTNLAGGQEIDLINAPTTASCSFAFYQTGNNNIRTLLFSLCPNAITFSPLAGGGTQCVQVSNTGVLTGTGSACGGSSGITQLTGDVTAGPGSGSQAATLATVNANVGSFGSATQCTTFTTNAKGLITAASAVTCTPAIASITGLGTGVGAALAVNIGSAGAPVLFNGVGGTPSSITLTNGSGLPTTALTGTLQAAQEPAHTGGVTNSAGSLALTVITNANLTGDVTSAGNATTYNNVLPSTKLAYNGAVLSGGAPSNPTGTTSATVVHMGLGVTTCRFTPTFSTRVVFDIKGSTNSTAVNGQSGIQFRYGTGAGPANGAAPTGTGFGSVMTVTSSTANALEMFAVGGPVTALSAGTTYWFDIAVSSSSGTATPSNITCSAYEF